MGTISIAEYKRLAKAGKVRTKTKPHRPKKRTGELPEAIKQMNLILAAEGRPFEREYIFHPKRKWRFDFAYPQYMIAIEYEGVFGEGKSRHTTVGGYTKDTTKYNEAAKLGWIVLRYTATSYSNLLTDLKEAIKTREVKTKP